MLALEITANVQPTRFVKYYTLALMAEGEYVYRKLNAGIAADDVAREVLRTRHYLGLRDSYQIQLQEGLHPWSLCNFDRCPAEILSEEHQTFTKRPSRIFEAELDSLLDDHHFRWRLQRQIYAREQRSYTSMQFGFPEKKYLPLF